MNIVDSDSSNNEDSMFAIVMPNYSPAKTKRMFLEVLGGMLQYLAQEPTRVLQEKGGQKNILQL